MSSPARIVTGVRGGSEPALDGTRRDRQVHD
jgi:hypothetical protein